MQYFVRGLAVLLFGCCLGATALASPDVQLEAAEPLGSIPRLARDQVDVRIDGSLDEAVWETLPVMDHFRVIDPDTLVIPRHSTRVRMFYTEDGLYIGVEAEQDASTLVRRLTARNDGVLRDNISVTLDPTGRGRQGYWFTIALGGSVQDGTVVPERTYNSEWDGPWEGATAETDEGWSAEMFLPWSMMAMPDDAEPANVGFYISRRVAYLDERWAIPAIPRTRSQFMSVLPSFPVENVGTGTPFTAFPYVSSVRDLERGGGSERMGADVYWRPSANLRLAATLNPDFGTAEQDDLVVNLSATETFFSEKRQFFLEGQDLFVSSPRASSFGNAPRMQLVNTRRIGAAPSLPPDPEIVGYDRIESQELSELYGAVRGSAQRGGLRLGALAAFEQDSTVTGFDGFGEAQPVNVPGRDFFALRGAWDQRLGSGAQRGTGATLTRVNRQEGAHQVAALDARVLTGDGVWQAETQLMASDTPDERGAGATLDVIHTPRQGVEHILSLDWLDSGLDLNALGYLARNDLRIARYRYLRTRSDLPHLRTQRTRVRVLQGWNSSGEQITSNMIAERTWTFHNLHELELWVSAWPAQWDDRNSRGNGSFRTDDRLGLNLDWQTDSSRPLRMGLIADARQEDLGDWTWRGQGFVEWRPRGDLSTRLDLLYRERNGWLLHQEDRDFALFDAVEWRPGISLDYFFTARQHLNLSMQWVGLKASAGQARRLDPDSGKLEGVDPLEAAGGDDFMISDLALQVRYRWEIAPLSDLFLIYNRGGQLQDPRGEHRDRDFGGLFRAAFSEPDQHEFALKLRYRLGT